MWYNSVDAKRATFQALGLEEIMGKVSKFTMSSESLSKNIKGRVRPEEMRG